MANYLQLINSDSIQYLNSEEVSALKFCLHTNTQELEESSIKQLVNTIEKLGYNAYFNLNKINYLEHDYSSTVNKEALIILEQLVNQSVKKIMNNKKDYQELFSLYETLKTNNYSEISRILKEYYSFKKQTIDDSNVNMRSSVLIQTTENNLIDNYFLKIRYNLILILTSLSFHWLSAEYEKDKKYSVNLKDFNNSISMSKINNNKNNNSSSNNKQTLNELLIKKINKMKLKKDKSLINEYLEELETVKTLQIDLYEDIKDIKLVKPEILILFTVSLHSFFPSLLQYSTNTKIAKIENYLDKLGLSLSLDIIEKLAEYYRYQLYSINLVNSIICIISKMQFLETNNLQSYYPELTYLVIKSSGNYSIEKEITKEDLNLKFELQSEFITTYKANKKDKYKKIDFQIDELDEEGEELEENTNNIVIRDIDKKSTITSETISKSINNYDDNKEKSSFFNFLKFKKSDTKEKFIITHKIFDNAPEIIADEKIFLESKKEQQQLIKSQLLEKKEYQKTIFSVIDPFFLIESLLKFDVTFNSLDSIIFEKINYFIYKGNNIVNVSLDFFNQDFSCNFNRSIRKLLLEMNLSGKSSDYLDYTFNDNYLEPMQITNQLFKQYNENLKILNIVFDSKIKNFSYLSFRFLPYSFVFTDSYITSANIFLYNLFVTMSKYKSQILMNSFDLETSFELDFRFGLNNKSLINSNTQNNKKNNNENDKENKSNRLHHNFYYINCNDCVIKKFSLKSQIASMELEKYTRNSSIRINKRRSTQYKNEDNISNKRFGNTKKDNDIKSKLNIHPELLKDVYENKNIFTKIPLSIFTSLLPIKHVIELNLTYLSLSNLNELIVLVQNNVFGKLKILKISMAPNYLRSIDQVKQNIISLISGEPLILKDENKKNTNKSNLSKTNEIKNSYSLNNNICNSLPISSIPSNFFPTTTRNESSTKSKIIYKLQELIINIKYLSSDINLFKDEMLNSINVNHLINKYIFNFGLKDSHFNKKQIFTNISSNKSSSLNIDGNKSKFCNKYFFKKEFLLKKFIDCFINRFKNNLVNKSSKLDKIELRLKKFLLRSKIEVYVS